MVKKKEYVSAVTKLLLSALQKFSENEQDCHATVVGGTDVTCKASRKQRHD